MGFKNKIAAEPLLPLSAVEKSEAGRAVGAKLPHIPPPPWSLGIVCTYGGAQQGSDCSLLPLLDLPILAELWHQSKELVAQGPAPGSCTLQSLGQSLHLSAQLKPN